jgi:DNA modification methylase
MTPGYIIGDSREITKLLKGYNGRVQSIITSPPYHNLLDYGGVSGQIGYNQKYDNYIEELADIFHKCFKLAHDNASLWLIVDTISKDKKIFPIPFDIWHALKTKYGKDTWVLRDIIIWDKYKSIPWHNHGRFKNRFEYILFFSKGSNFKHKIDSLREAFDHKDWWLSYPERYNPGGSPPHNIWQIAIPLRGWGNGTQNHLCPFPFALAERIITLSSDKGDLIVDPFAGSGTVLAMAYAMGRRAIGIDINREYKDKYQMEVMPGALAYWKTRKASLATLGRRKRKFKILNYRLRKIKAAFAVCNSLWEKNIHNFIGILISEPQRDKFAKLYIAFTSAKINIINAAEVASISPRIEVDYGIKLKVTATEIHSLAFLKKRHEKLYIYRKDRIYSSISAISGNEIELSNPKDGRLYSNISVRLSKKQSFTENLMKI